MTTTLLNTATGLLANLTANSGSQIVHSEVLAKAIRQSRDLLPLTTTTASRVEDVLAKLTADTPYLVSQLAATQINDVIAEAIACYETN